MQGGIYSYTYRPRSLVAVSGGSTYPWERDSASFHNPQISEDAYSVDISDYSFIRYGPEIDGYWTQYHADAGFQPAPALVGLGSVPPASIKVPTYVSVPDTDTTHATHDLWPDHMSTSTFSDQSYQVDGVPNLASPALTETYSFSTTVRYEGTSSVRSNAEPKKPYKCSVCGKRYALKQSVGRHYRKRHDANPCLFSSCDFKWGGPYDYRHHLKGQHEMENEVINMLLGKTAESHCRATIIGRKPF